MENINMKRVILTSLVSLAAFSSVMSADIKPAQANARGVYVAGKAAYQSAQEGNDGALIFFGLLFAGGVISVASKAK